MLLLMPLVASLLNAYRIDVEPSAELQQVILDVRVDQRVMMLVSFVHDRADKFLHWTVKFNFKRVTPDYLFSIKSGSLCDQHPVPVSILVQLCKGYRSRLE